MAEELDEGLSVGALARRLGVATSTLRSWDRRYGIGPSRRSGGSHRRYTPQDVLRLQAMQKLILDGVPPAEAARSALGGEVAAPPADGRAHGQGGRRLALGSADAEARRLARAAMAMDEPVAYGLLRTVIRRDGVVNAWNEVVTPVLRSVGERVARTGECVEVEHLLSAQSLVCLAEVPKPPVTRNARPVLLACAPEEQHSLPVYALAAALAEAGIASRLLGARTPAKALADAIERIGPGAVFVWSQTAETGDPGWLAELPVHRPAVRLLVGGPGWAGELPEGVSRPLTLVGAVDEVETALGLG
ncbi:MerR family transcriptional regulator [Actinocorallia longicatena]|uniref:MerR family transcriptional regulator n=1 Tax=Actinocorallia longicatena TaxID=111803 RepID=A0ABP6QDX9_9ACTN